MAAAASVKPSRRGIVQRFTGKVGPLPVWAWALLILAAGYLVYRLTAGGTSSSATTAASTSTDTTSADTTAGGDTGSPPASGQGGAADNLSSDVFSQLTGLQGSIDSLTGLVQTTPAFGAGDGSAGSGSTIPNDGTNWGGPTQTEPVAVTTPPATKPPAARAPAPATVRYYTYAPGKAPRSRPNDAAPARGPAGTTLRFARGRGYYYA